MNQRVVRLTDSLYESITSNPDWMSEIVQEAMDSTEQRDDAFSQRMTPRSPTPIRDSPRSPSPSPNRDSPRSSSPTIYANNASEWGDERIMGIVNVRTPSTSLGAPRSSPYRDSPRSLSPI